MTPSKPVIITIDGPAGTGKSSVARKLAARLGLDFLDTGAMYRAAAAIALDRGLSVREHAEIVRVVGEADIRFDWTSDPPTIQAWGASMAHRIRDQDVTRVVSPIAGIAELRRLMVQKQQRIAAEHPRLVTEGRDQGSVVFPNAPLKFYLDADAGVRAKRRADQLVAEGLKVSLPDLAALEREIEERDDSDRNRADGPLRCPGDAVRIDTSGLTLEGVVETMERIVRERLGLLD